ncbi:hypothetical protein VB711_19150 [Cronbergia sp. UHCC 0137]|uniref:hypothetical protein n=1 Tax=Cronbergia sp. UHCC 0137 TaxID=3110239 RepID=UPI002B1ED6F8|nr:hypothetical protein [Cronbergia sp. UHCC 0137]MEA5619945.1 hypothetical protein [Cronbergia sp. UHCC 0137]
MKANLVFQDLSIIIATRNHNPRILTYDFLKCSDIIPMDWELAQEPIVSEQGSQVIFSNALSLVAQPERLFFVEVFKDKGITDLQVPAIAHKYVKALPNVEYQAVGINLRAYVSPTQADGEAEVQNYMQNLLAPGAWQTVGDAPVQPSIKLTFTLKHCQFNLSINEGVFHQQDQETSPIILFSGNFSYNIEGNNKDERFKSLHQSLDNWKTDLETYQEIIQTKFLAPPIPILQDAPETLEREVIKAR